MFSQTLLWGNVFVITDEINMFNSRFGVYGVNDESRATDSSIFTIKYDTISLLGTSTGDKLWTNRCRFAEDFGCDGLAVRLTYHIWPLLPMNEPPIDYLVLLPVIFFLYSLKTIEFMYRRKHKPLFILSD